MWCLCNLSLFKHCPDIAPEIVIRRQSAPAALTTLKKDLINPHEMVAYEKSVLGGGICLLTGLKYTGKCIPVADRGFQRGLAKLDVPVGRKEKVSKWLSSTSSVTPVRGDASDCDFPKGPLPAEEIDRRRKSLLDFVQGAKALFEKSLDRAAPWDVYKVGEVLYEDAMRSRWRSVRCPVPGVDTDMGTKPEHKLVVPSSCMLVVPSSCMQTPPSWRRKGMIEPDSEEKVTKARRSMSTQALESAQGMINEQHLQALRRIRFDELELPKPTLGSTFRSKKWKIGCLGRPLPKPTLGSKFRSNKWKIGCLGRPLPN